MKMTVDTTQHSPLGGSGAYRWMPCPGSVALSYGVEDEESEYATVGLQAHALAEWCLRGGRDAWELVRDDSVVDREMADAVQVYLNAVRNAHPARTPKQDRAIALWGKKLFTEFAHGSKGLSWVELGFYCPSIHEYFWGKADFVYWHKSSELHVWDYKHGAGIVVEVVQNPQLMYYGCGALESLNLWDKVDRVVLHVAQPRGFHFDGPIRSWAVSTEDLRKWMNETLAPAMDRALASRETASGEHCRFCLVRGRACPQIMADVNELEELVKKMNLKGKGTARALNAKETGRLLTLMIPALIAKKQALKNATGMLNSGSKVPGWKLAKARSNRKFKDGAEAEAIKKFGKKKAFTTPELKSPAQIEAMPEGEAFNTRWAFKPNTGETVVPETDSRATVSKDTKSGFTPASKKGRK